MTLSYLLPGLLLLLTLLLLGGLLLLLAILVDLQESEGVRKACSSVAAGIH